MFVKLILGLYFVLKDDEIIKVNLFSILDYFGKLPNKFPLVQ